MNQIRSGTGATAAVLAGSLAVFPLLDVLSLLSRTKHAGELQVVGDHVEAHLWVDGGDLIDRPAAAADRLFELACLDDAWFTVTVASRPDKGADEANRVPLEPLIEQVAPQVAEWQTLVKALPFGAVAKMAPSMPGPDVHIRSDQWRILSLIGAGRPVHEVVDVSDARPLETLRLVHELAAQELISVELPVPDSAERSARHKAHPARPTPSASTTTEQPPSDERSAARVVPVRTVSASPAGVRRGAGTSTVTVPDKHSGAAVHEKVEAANGADSFRAPRPAVAAYMPPPVSPGDWPLPATGTARPQSS